MIGIDLRKQQTLDAYPKAIQKVSFTGNLARQATVFSLLKKQKKTVLCFSQETVKAF